MTLTRQQWLEKRMHHIGASEVAAILGFDDRYCALDVYHAKVNGFSQRDTDWMMYGRLIEGAIAAMYSHKSGNMISDLGATEIQYHPDCDFLGATLDRQAIFETSEIGPLELKNIGGYYSSPKKFREQPPRKFLIQNTIQMACTSAKRGCIAAMFPGVQIAWVEHELNESFMTAALPLLEEFWKCVKDKTPPKLTDHAQSLSAIKRIWNSDIDGKVIAMPSDSMQLVKDWEKYKREEKESESKKKNAEAKLREIIKDATFGALIDGTYLKLKADARGIRSLKHVKKLP